jgi:hypothetical protein
MPLLQGDWKDWFWMIAATCVFTYAAACLFMIYLHVYRMSGMMTIAEYLSRS